MDNNKNFSKRLFELMKTNKCTQQQLADNIGVSRQAIASWLNGTTSPSILAASKIADYFNVTIDSLMERPYPRKGSFNIDDLPSDIFIEFNSKAISILSETIKRLIRVADSYDISRDDAIMHYKKKFYQIELAVLLTSSMELDKEVEK